MDLILLRVLFVGVVATICFFLQPFGVSAPIAAGVGAAASCAVIVFELRVRALNLRRLIGAVTGSVLGIIGASLFCLVLRSALPAGPTSATIQVFVLMLMTYVGLLVGTSKGDLLNPAALGTIFTGEKINKKSFKVLDTSVIIDGRIADVAETGFMDGTYVIPEFVLRELQIDIVAEVLRQADGLRRQQLLVGTLNREGDGVGDLVFGRDVGGRDRQRHLLEHVLGHLDGRGCPVAVRLQGGARTFEPMFELPREIGVRILEREIRARHHPRQRVAAGKAKAAGAQRQRAGDREPDLQGGHD